MLPLKITLVGDIVIVLSLNTPVIFNRVGTLMNVSNRTLLLALHNCLGQTLILKENELLFNQKTYENIKYVGVETSNL